MTWYSWAPSSGDHLVTWGAIYRPPQLPKLSHKVLVETQTRVEKGQNWFAQRRSNPELRIFNVTRTGFKPIWSISSNRVPRRRGPRARPVNKHKFVLCIEADCECFRRGVQSFSRSFETKRFLNYSKVSQNSYNSLYYHHQNTRKPCFTIISVFR